MDLFLKLALCDVTKKPSEVHDSTPSSYCLVFVPFQTCSSSRKLKRKDKMLMQSIIEHSVVNYLPEIFFLVVFQKVWLHVKKLLCVYC